MQPLAAGRSPEGLVQGACLVRRTEVREARRVGCRLEPLAREDARRLVLAVPVARRSTEDRDDDVRPEAADYADHIGQHAIAWPVRERLVRALREAVVVGAREELLCAIEPAGRQQLAAPDETQTFLQLRTDQVLAAFAACER